MTNNTTRKAPLKCRARTILQQQRPNVRRIVVRVLERVLLALVSTDRRHVLQDGHAPGKSRRYGTSPDVASRNVERFRISIFREVIFVRDELKTLRQE